MGVVATTLTIYVSDDADYVEICNFFDFDRNLVAAHEKKKKTAKKTDANFAES